MLGRYRDAVVDVTAGEYGAAVTVGRTATGETGVLDAFLGFDPGAKDPDDGPHTTLSAESAGTVSEAEGGVQIREMIPLDGEEDGLGWIDLEPSIPATVIKLKHDQSLARVQGAALLDEGDDGVGGGKKQLPILPAMEVGGDVAVNADAVLTAIGDCTSDRDFVDGAEGRPEHGEGQLVVGEGADQGTVLQLGGDVGVDVLGGDVGGAKIAGGVFGMGRSQEREIPAVGEGCDELVGIEVALQRETPRLEGEGWPWKRDLEGVHVRRRSR